MTIVCEKNGRCGHANGFNGFNVFEPVKNLLVTLRILNHQLSLPIDWTRQGRLGTRLLRTAEQRGWLRLLLFGAADKGGLESTP